MLVDICICGERRRETTTLVFSFFLKILTVLFSFFFEQADNDKSLPFRDRSGFADSPAFTDLLRAMSNCDFNRRSASLGLIVLATVNVLEVRSDRIPAGHSLSPRRYREISDWRWNVLKNVKCGIESDVISEELADARKAAQVIEHLSLHHVFCVHVIQPFQSLEGEEGIP